jgi:hypothetical protein
VGKPADVFLSVQKHFSPETKIWAWIIRSRSKFGRKENGPCENREVCPPALFVRGNVGQVLQPRVPDNGKDARDRLPVPTLRMQREDALVRQVVNQLQVKD